MNYSGNNTVILGGNGKTGSRVAARLQAAGRSVRMASRSTEIPFDWNDEASWQSTLQGAEALYLTYFPDLAVSGAAEHVEGLSRMAAQMGVEKIVLLAGRGEPQVHPAENAVRNCGVDFTILECAFFAQNFSEGVLAPVEDVVVFPAGDVEEPFIDCDDIADVAVAALTEAKHSGKTYELTGPKTLTFSAATAALASASGKRLRYQQLSFDDYGKLLGEQMPPPQVQFFIELFRFLLDGHNGYTTNHVENILGRPATSFREYASNAASGKPQ